MIAYDKTQPLIVIHIPKAGGTTSGEIFQSWFGTGLLRHYFNDKTDQLPNKYDVFGMHSTERPIALYGHFNKLRNFGIEDYYPEVKQFVTILRDPFELCVSSYFYMRKNQTNWKDKTRIPGDDIEKHLLNTKPNMLNHFPREVTKENYKEIIEKYFIDIGIVEHFNESMKRLSQKLGFSYEQRSLGHLNATERDQIVPAYLRDAFMEKNQLEYNVYDYALLKFI